MADELQEVVLLDVTPHNWASRSPAIGFVVIQAIPASDACQEGIATTEDNQTFVAIEIHQGEHDLRIEETGGSAGSCSAI